METTKSEKPASVSKLTQYQQDAMRMIKEGEAAIRKLNDLIHEKYEEQRFSDFTSNLDSTEP